MSASNPEALIALNQARYAYNHGKTMEAKKYAEEAIRIDHNLEEAWLILAAISTPEASIAYLTTVVQINPMNLDAQNGLAWANERMEKAQHLPESIEIKEKFEPPIHTKSLPQEQRANPSHGKNQKNGDPPRPVRFFLSSFILTGIIVVFIASSILSMVPKHMFVLARNFSQEFPTGVVVKPTLTPTGTMTSFPTPTATQTPTVTITPSSTSTLPYTSTPAPLSTSVPMLLPGVLKVPDEIEADEKWIDVNVSSQTVYAMQGSEIINDFLVSTGKIDTLTVMGKFRVYLKFETAPMRGEDYYYPEIPYVMYFFEGYGFHGVTWPLKVGAPTSYGCINMLTSDAEWLYHWAEIGTLINVHY